MGINKVICDADAVNSAIEKIADAITAEMNADAATEADIIDEVVALEAEEIVSEEISDFSAEE